MKIGNKFNYSNGQLTQQLECFPYKKEVAGAHPALLTMYT